MDSIITAIIEITRNDERGILHECWQHQGPRADRLACGAMARWERDNRFLDFDEANAVYAAVVAAIA